MFLTDTAAGDGRSPETDLTLNGCHLNEEGNAIFAKSLYEGVFLETAPEVNQRVRKVVTDKNQQYFRRYRPVNTFYYTGGRNKSYGYLDFLPAMQNFDIMVGNRNQQIWDLAAGKQSQQAGSPISQRFQSSGTAPYKGKPWC